MKWTESQQAAISLTGANIIVSAGAGSGKTAVLSERVMEKIRQGIDVNRILILTFANAAAAEMKERIRKKIMLNEEYQAQLPLLDISHITTFDGFSLSLVNKYHYLLNLDKKVSICPNSILNVALINIIDEVFNIHYYEALNNQEPTFTKLINELCLKDDHSLKKTLLNFYYKLELKIDQKSFLDNYQINYQNDSFAELLINKYWQIIEEEVKQLIPLLKELIVNVDPNKSDELAVMVENIVFAKTYQDLKIAINNLDLPRVTTKCQIAYKDGKDLVKKQIEVINKYLIYDSFVDMINEFKLTYPNVITIVNLLKEIDEKYQQYKRINKLYSFIDIAKYAISLVKNNEEVRQSLKYQFKEIMIDEYQDTSDLQNLFISYISNNNVYMVGDIKQSIYGFRNANPLFFKHQYDSSIDYREKTLNSNIRIDLVNNFRSRKEVLSSINTIFNLVMTDKYGGADYKESHRMVSGNSLYKEQIERDHNEVDYQLELLNTNTSSSMQLDEINKKYSNQEKEAFAIAYDIKNKLNNHYQVMNEQGILRDANLNDFTILLATSEAFPLYKKVFAYHGLSLNVVKDESMLSGYDLLIIKNIMKMIHLININEVNTAEFKYLFVSIARSFLFTIDDQTIYQLIEDSSYYKSNIFLIAKSISQNIKIMSNRQIIEMIFKEYQITSKAHLVGRIENLRYEKMYLLSLADAMNKNYQYLEAFCLHLEDIIENKIKADYKFYEQTNNSVKMMTIHNSKGLEFPICYFPSLSKQFNMEEANSNYNFTNELDFIIPVYKHYPKATFVKKICQKRIIDDMLAERIRLWYVALTRAKEKIIIVTNYDQEVKLKDPSKWNSYFDLMNYCFKNLLYQEIEIAKDLILTKDYLIPPFNEYKTLGIDAESITTNEQYQNKINNKEEPINKHYSKLPGLISQADKSKMNIGTALHEILEHIDLHDPNYQLTLRTLTNNEFYINKIISFLEQPLMKNRFKAKIYQEYPFIDNQQIGIIDLMLEYEDKIIIIDYKLKNIDDPAYIKQLNGYQAYIMKMTDKTVETYLYSLLGSYFQEIKK